MPQIARCPNCTSTLEIPDHLVGRDVRCAHCRSIFRASSLSPSINANHSCPACQAARIPAAQICPECGFLFTPSAEVGAELDTTRNLCPNPACNVANPPKERLCQRCNTPLPAAMGQTIAGRFQIERPLATGGFGIVYLGKDPTTQQRVAIKEMIDVDPKEAAIRRTFFRREADILRLLQPLAIVPRLHAFVESESNAYLVMEYIPGHDLLHLLQMNPGKPFPLENVIRWGAQICEVLTFMHRQDPPIVHRDLKPENLMLLPDQQSIRMIDFGTARVLGKAGQERSVARTKVFTEGYAPPEQIIGKPEPRSDLFALAGTLYHLVSGQAPEGFFTSREIFARLKDRESGISSESAWLYELLAINLSENPTDRYGSAEEMRLDFLEQKVTRERICSACRTINPRGEPYCRQCSEALTSEETECSKCHGRSRLGSRFCIHCGNRIG